MASSSAPWFSKLLDQSALFASPQTRAQDLAGAGVLPMAYAGMPLTGFAGVQRTPHGPATWLNQGVNLGGLEWLIPLLTPNQTPDDIQALLAGGGLSSAQRERTSDRSVAFAQQQEQAVPGTFAKFPTVIEALAAAMGSGKNWLVPRLPEPVSVPGRPTTYRYGGY